MPNFDIVKEVCPKKTFRVASVLGTFDIQTEHIKEHFSGSFDLPDKWQIGLIVGNSGTGKTTIAKELFKKAYITHFQYSHETVLDDMPEGCSVKDICRAFNSVGFSSPPSWLKPYSVLSNGEKMRCDLARAMLSPDKLFVFDEFTSVVDRNVAKIGSFAMQKAIRHSTKQFIAVSCHEDIEEWLLPDWVFDTNTMTFRNCESQKKNRPGLRFKIYEINKKPDKQYYWKMFSRYHYLSSAHNDIARTFIATINDVVCGFISVLHFPHPKTNNYWRVHRVVVLPDFQGIGLGILLLNQIGNFLFRENKTLLLTTSSPAAIFSCKNSPEWITTRIGRTASIKNKIGGISTCSSNRITVGFKKIH